MSKETIKKLRSERKLNGLCTQCGIKLDRKGTLCIKCNNRNNLLSRINKNKRRENGLCPHCGKPIDRDGRYCIKCTEKLKLVQRKRRKN